MIGKILTVPKADVIVNKEYYEKEDNLLISIMSSYRPPIFEKDTDRTITLFFDDVYPCHWVYSKQKDKYPYKFCSSEDAKKIVKFIQRHSRSNKKETLQIQCTLGIYRSGAVARYALKYSRMNIEDFHRLNKKISPNEWVLDKLVEAEFELKGKQ